MLAQAMKPPLRMSSGFTPNSAGLKMTRSASFPTSIEPTMWEMPWAMAGLMVYLAQIAEATEVVGGEVRFAAQAAKLLLSSCGRSATCG